LIASAFVAAHPFLDRGKQKYANGRNNTALATRQIQIDSCFSSKPPSPFVVERSAPLPEPLFPRWRCRTGLDRSEETMLGTILIIILILLLVGALPTWPYSNGWGYYPGGGLGLILIIVIVLVLVGRI
jgi:Protein of unknown function (DUF3309)